MSIYTIPSIHNNEELKNACAHNLENVVLENNIPFNWNTGLYGASRACNIKLINKMIENGANDFNWALRGVSENGNIEMINYIECLIT